MINEKPQPWTKREKQISESPRTASARQRFHDANADLIGDKPKSEPKPDPSHARYEPQETE